MKIKLNREAFRDVTCKNLVDLVKKLELLKFEQNPDYDDIAADFSAIEEDRDTKRMQEEEHRKKMEQN